MPTTVARVVRSLFVLAVVTSSVAFGQSSDGSAVARLAERLLGYWGDPSVSRAEIFPESLPADLPIELPLPSQAILVGSVAHYERGALTTVQIVVDALQAADDALGSVLQTFEARGWIAAPMPPAVGFLPVQTAASGQACDPETGIFTFVHATERPSAPTDLRIDINLAAVQYNPPCHAAALVPQPYESAAPIPALPALVGSELHPHSTVQMPDQGSSTAILVLDVSLADVAAHYAARLARVGWQVEEALAEATVVVVHASHVDADGSQWHGTLSVVQPSGATSTFALSFFVTKVPGGGGATTSP